jgi:hypothetical protein
MVVLVLTACTRSTASSNAQPLDVYAAEPTLLDVRTLLNDSTWWPGPPTLGVRPLDSTSMPMTERFSVTQPYVHIGTAETFDVQYSVWSTVSAATTEMTNIQNSFGTSATGPKEGDQVLYYGSQLSGAAPYATATIVRVGPIVATISWSSKDAFPTVATLGKIAAKMVTLLKKVNAGKVHATPLSATDSALLPPPGFDITLLGSARIPTEAAVMMIGPSSPAGIAQALHGSGVDDIVYGDYVLDTDTRMEVRAGLFTFQSTAEASTWLDVFRGTYALDQNGIAAFYHDPSGQYFFLFISGMQGGSLICRSAVQGEAASRACEGPLTQTALSWKVSLGG